MKKSTFTKLSTSLAVLAAAAAFTTATLSVSACDGPDKEKKPEQSEKK